MEKFSIVLASGVDLTGSQKETGVSSIKLHFDYYPTTQLNDSTSDFTQGSLISTGYQEHQRNMMRLEKRELSEEEKDLLEMKETARKYKNQYNGYD